MFEELAWERQRKHIDSLCQRKSRTILGGGLEAELYQKEVGYPGGTSQSCPERGFQGRVKPLNHTITLWMKTRSLNPGDSEDETNLLPD